MRAKDSSGARAVASGSAVPYGYTVTLWSSGAGLSHVHGPPDLVRIARFIVSAIAGYNLVGARRRGAGAGVGDDVRIVAGMLSWVAVGCAVAAAWTCSQQPSAGAWGTGPGAATLVYLTLVAVQLAAAEARTGA